MKVELRGSIKVSLGIDNVEVEMPAGGVPLSRVLEAVAETNPRATPYLRREGSGQAVLRVVHNGTVVPTDDDPLVQPEDSLLLMHAVAGG